MIRPAIAKDEQAITKCAQQAYARYISRIGRKPAPMIADFSAQIAECKVYVSTDEAHNIEGFIVFYAEDQYIHLENVAVFPQKCGRGIGKKLIDFCEQTALKSGLNAVQLCTNEKMTENLSIYSRLGYIEVDRRTEEGFNRVYFEKVLV